MNACIRLVMDLISEKHISSKPSENSGMPRNNEMAVPSGFPVVHIPNESNSPMTGQYRALLPLSTELKPLESQIRQTK